MVVSRYFQIVWAVVLVFVLLSTVVYAQHTVTDTTLHAFYQQAAIASYATQPLPDSTRQPRALAHFLGQTAGDLQLDHPGAGLELLYIRESPGGLHYTFRQTMQGLPVYGTQVKVHVDHNRQLRSRFYHVLSPERYAPDGQRARAMQPGHTDRTFLAQRYPERTPVYDSTEVMLYLTPEDRLIPVYRIRVSVPGVDAAREFLVDAEGVLRHSHDRAVYHSSTDTTARALVFMPDPITSAEVTEYAPPYVDSNDNDVVELNAERVEVTIPVTFEDDSFRLTGPYARMMHISGPDRPPAVADTDTFFFTRSQSGFEDVNAFYHIHAAQEHIQGIGFTGLADYPIRVDAHGDSDDNSFFYPDPEKTLIFGTGGVDDAEDAHVILHEYGHAISYSAAPETIEGQEREALEEGFGDYLAVSYSRDIDDFRWYDVFTWDGHNEFWPGRKADTDKFYPDDKTGNIHMDGEIWSSVLMEIWEEVGRDVTDVMVIQSVYSYSANMQMTDAAKLLLQADSLLYNAQHQEVLVEYLTARGLLESEEEKDTTPKAPPQDTIRITNSYAFAVGEGPLHIMPPDSATTVQLSVYDVHGRQMEVYEQAGPAPIEYYGTHLAHGMYILRVQTDYRQKTVKLLRIWQ